MGQGKEDTRSWTVVIIHTFFAFVKPCLAFQEIPSFSSLSIETEDYVTNAYQFLLTVFSSGW